MYPMAIFSRRTQSDGAGRPWLGLADLGGILCRAMVGATAPPVAPAVGLIIALSISHLTDDSCNQVSHLRPRKYVAFKMTDYFGASKEGIDGPGMDMRLFPSGTIGHDSKALC